MFSLFAETPSPDGGAVCGLGLLVVVAVIFGLVLLSSTIKAVRRGWKDTWKD